MSPYQASALSPVLSVSVSTPIDISIPGSRNVKAIHVDARTGAVLSNAVEAPEDR